MVVWCYVEDAQDWRAVIPPAPHTSHLPRCFQSNTLTTPPPASKSTGPAARYNLLKPAIVMIGDSITELGTYAGGWQQLLSEAYVRKVGE